MEARTAIDGARRGMRRIARLGVGVLFAFGLMLMPAAAQLPDADQAKLTTEKEALFQKMLRDPGNLDVTFAYADIAARLGDNEAAVAALERMLLFNPNLPRVDLELGALYFRMQSYDLAQTYFDKALAASPPPDVRDRVKNYLARISSDSSPSQLSGYVLFGTQYQSDANLAPAGGLVFSPIGPVVLQSEFVKQKDFNLFANGAIQYSYDLGTQDRDAIELGSTIFANHYFKFGRLDLDLLEVTGGPRLRFPDIALPVVRLGTLKPYAIFDEVGLGEHQYFWAYGTGIETTAELPADISARAFFEFRQKYFTNASDRPLTSGLSGNDKLVTLLATKLLTRNSALGFEFDYLDQDTSFPFYANKSYAVSTNYRIRYDDPTGTLRLPWETAVYVSRSWTLYNAPDPCCNVSSDLFNLAFARRHDRRWRIGLTQTFSITDNIALVTQL